MRDICCQGTKWIYTKSACELHMVLQELYERLQNFETKNTPEGSDISSSKKREQQIRQQPDC